MWAVLEALEAGDGPILWNTKSKGSEHVLRDVFAGPLGARSWVFDHDYEATDPDLPQRFPEGRYLWRGGNYQLRDGDGYWVDDADLPHRSFIVGSLPTEPVMGYDRHFFVSPELHRRPLDLAFARRALDAGAWLCTDVPHLFEALYANPACEPVEPWWGA